MRSCTTSTKAATSCSVVFSRSRMASTVKSARSRTATASAAGTTPSFAQASVARISTSSQARNLASSVKRAAISGSA